MITNHTDNKKTNISVVVETPAQEYERLVKLKNHYDREIRWIIKRLYDLKKKL